MTRPRFICPVYFHDRLLYEDRSDVIVIDNTDISVAETIRKIL